MGNSKTKNTIDIEQKQLPSSLAKNIKFQLNQLIIGIEIKVRQIMVLTDQLNKNRVISPIMSQYLQDGLINDIIGKIDLVRTETIDFLDIIYSELVSAFEEEEADVLEQVQAVEFLLKNNFENCFNSLKIPDYKKNKKGSNFELINWAIEDNKKNYSIYKELGEDKILEKKNLIDKNKLDFELKIPFENSVLSIKGIIKGKINSVALGESKYYVVSTDQGFVYQISQSDYSNNVLELFVGNLFMKR